MTGPRDYQDYLADMLEAADKVAGMRDKLVHDYFGVNTQVVWKTAAEDVPAIAAALREVGP